MDTETIRSYPLGKYVGEFFATHAEVGNVLSRIGDGVDCLFDPDKPHFKIFVLLKNGGFDVDPEELDIEIDSGSDSDDSSSEQSSSDQSSSDQSISDQSSSEGSFSKHIPRWIYPLYCTVLCRDLCFTRHLILKRAHDLDASDIYGKTALHVAAINSDFEATRILIEHTADINARDNRGCTPLHFAVVKGEAESQDNHFRCVRLLLERGADADAQNNRGMTPLHLAVSRLDIDEKFVQILIGNVTNINLRNIQGQTALHKAALLGDTDIMSIILNHDADVDAQDNSGLTPLHLSISEFKLPFVELLLQHGANVGLHDNNHQTPLHLASQRGLFDIMRLLLGKGADVDALDSDGSTPLHLIISKTYTYSEVPESSEASHDSKVFIYSESLREAIKLLLEHGASVHREKNRGETPFQAAGVRGLPRT